MRVIVGSYAVRYPLGGNVSHVLQYLIGLAELGHDVFLVEKAGYQDSCYDPVLNVMTSDCSRGVATVSVELERVALGGRLCYVDESNNYHGISRRMIEETFATADAYIEMGSHEAWEQESAHVPLRVAVDGDPGFSQIWMADRRASGESVPSYDAYFTVGSRLADGTSKAPDGGVRWEHTFHPVATAFFSGSVPASEGSAYTTVMNWKSYKTVEYQGEEYGHKSVEFEKFLGLPSMTRATMEAAIAGHGVPYERLESNGWRLASAHQVTRSVDAFVRYIVGSRGEFTVCKNGFVALETGWFGDRSSAYLACGRPVVVQDTGFGSVLPCGQGIFAVADVNEAAAAIDEIEGDYAAHSTAAREIAAEYLEARNVMRRMLDRATRVASSGDVEPTRAD